MTLRDSRTLAALLVALTVAAGVGAVSSGATAQTTVDSCTTITESGTYALTADIENAGDTAISQSCIEIRADDVTFDGNGHTIAGRGESHTNAVAVSAADGVEVRNVEVHDWHAGVVAENASVTVSEVHTHANAYGVRLENTSAEVSNNTVEENLVGVYAEGDGDVSLSDNELSGNEIPTKGVGNATTTATADS